MSKSPESHKRKAEAAGISGDIFDPAKLTAVEVGPKKTHDYRVFFEYNGIRVSPWHDVPLIAKDGLFHFLCEIPKWTRAKFEVSKEDHNPIKQDEKKGVLRDYKWGDMPFNYGMFPQTWENPQEVDPDAGFKGDNDPLDAVEVGFRQMACGQVAAVKVLGVLAMIDDGETDWKVLCLRADDPLAASVNDIADLERELPGAVHALREWLRDYKVPEGKPENKFALGERAMPAAFAKKVINHTHGSWREKFGDKVAATVPFTTIEAEEAHGIAPAGEEGETGRRAPGPNHAAAGAAARLREPERRREH